ncbi:hypothetical protein CDD80_1408 [Ophiocordyceps camponoti-rufipedis]|uniref:GAF domain-containing protein n=1 Tax=Ophiocordyceps camponoti-rufipedis TaxID=2004952 RepID=A0A2C5Z6E4_9HYPO|nr:hypothetical protein CDD80_1408 [Ophiocordyceps camponoti-rufipedis]
MVHADATEFANDVTKDEVYDQLLLQARALFAGQRNWVRFYVMDRSSSPPRLLLGPFQGKVACQSIELGRGVCGRAAASGETQVVDDVDEDVNHIACDSASKSEMVVPVAMGQAGRDVVAVIDIDCAAKHGFDDCDKRKLQLLAELLSESCDW